jgi:hypothetical protein
VPCLGITADQTKPKLAPEETTMNQLKLKIYASVAAGVIALLISAIPASASQPQVIDFPGALQTTASGINATGTIVGWYCPAKHSCNALNLRGFLLANGAFCYIDVPNSPEHPAVATQPRYISPQGVVIGTYATLEGRRALDGSPRFRGFAWYSGPESNCQGTFTYFDAPDTNADGELVYDTDRNTDDNPKFAHSIIPRAINAEGHIVGCVHDKDQGDSMHGFVLSSETGVISTLAGGMTMNNGITESGEVVGNDFDMSTGYHISKSGDVETLSMTGIMAGSPALQAWDINSRGEIVGTAVVDGVQRAFVRSKRGDYSLVGPDDALAATAFSINANGSIVGNYRDIAASNPVCGTSACVHGFLVQRGSTPEEN